MLDFQNVSILDALEKHPEKGCIIEAMNKPVADERLHRVMVKAACSYLLDICGRQVYFSADVCLNGLAASLSELLLAFINCNQAYNQ